MARQFLPETGPWQYLIRAPPSHCASRSGVLGLVLPGLLHLRADLTPLAALGLVIIMSGALSVSLTTGHADTAAIPIVVGIGLAIVAVVRGMLLQPPRA